MSDPLKTVHINYCDEFSGPKVSALMEIIANIFNQDKPDTIYLTMSSTGGEVDPGLALYNFLRGMPVKLITHNIGTVCSMANVVFLAGGERYANPRSSFLLHGNHLSLSKDEELSLGRIKELTSILEQSQNKMAGVIVDRTLLKIGEIGRLLVQGEAWSPDFAKEKGIIDDVREFRIGSGIPTHSINFR